MVAYSFKGQFVEPIATLRKRQTVRGLRKRHARAGELVQLYAGMRTRNCFKIIDPDPVCTAIQVIRIDFDAKHPDIITLIELDGRRLTDEQIEQFAIDDGFGASLAEGFARRRMGEFWAATYERNCFLGALIRWEPQT